MEKEQTESWPPETLVRMTESELRKPITEDQRRELEALNAMPDSEIDFSDIPEITDFSGFRPLQELLTRLRRKELAAKETVANPDGR